MKRVCLAVAVLLAGWVAFGAEGDAPAAGPDARELLKGIPVLTERDEKIESLLLTMTLRLETKEQPLHLNARLSYRKPDKYSLCVMDKAGVPIFVGTEGRMLLFDSTRQRVLSMPARARPSFQVFSTEPLKIQCKFGLRSREEEGKADEPAIRVDIASVFTGYEGKLTATAAGKTMILSAVSDEGNEMRAHVVPGTPFPCIAFDGRMKDGKEPMVVVRMSVNGPPGAKRPAVPDLRVLKKHLERALKKHLEVVEREDKEAVLSFFKTYLQTWMSILLVRVAPDTPEARAGVEKMLKRKIDWDAAKEFDRKVVEALREAETSGTEKPE